MGSQTHMVWENGRLCFYRHLTNCPCSAMYLNMCLNAIVCKGTGAHELLVTGASGPVWGCNSVIPSGDVKYSLNQSPVNLAFLNYDISHSYTCLLFFFFSFFLFHFFISSTSFWCPDGCIWTCASQDAMLNVHSHRSSTLHRRCCYPANTRINVVQRNVTLLCPQHHDTFWVWWWRNNWLEKVSHFW